MPVAIITPFLQLAGMNPVGKEESIFGVVFDTPSLMAYPPLMTQERRINHKLLIKYGADISIVAMIGPEMKASHYVGVIVPIGCAIGRNFKLRQNTAIRRKDSESLSGMTVFGDNVDIGALNCNIGDITTGSNFAIGAASFFNKDKPENSEDYCDKRLIIKIKG